MYLEEEIEEEIEEERTKKKKKKIIIDKPQFKSDLKLFVCRYCDVSYTQHESCIYCKKSKRGK